MLILFTDGCAAHFLELAIEMGKQMVNDGEEMDKKRLLEANGCNRSSRLVEPWHQRQRVADNKQTY